MSIEIKNYGEIRYIWESRFGNIPARYIRDDVYVFPKSKDVKPELAEVKLMLIGAKKESDNKLAANKDDKGEENWNNVLQNIIFYFDKKIAKTTT